MPRKQVVRPLGAKPNELGMKRKNAPGRYAETTKKLEEAAGQGDPGNGKRCAWDNRIETVNGKETVLRCTERPTEYVRWAWFCSQHAPPRGKEGCHHCVRSPLWGRWVCQTCSADLGPLPERAKA